MHLTPSLLSSICKRLIPAFYGISLKGVHIQTQFEIEPTSAGTEATVQVGEDASFVCVKPSSRYHVCGVADGVGGWVEKGVDPSFFSKVLMESCCRVASRESVDLTKPVEIISRALSELRSMHSKCYGSSTACVLSLDTSTGMLYTANLGDSGYVIYRGGQIIEESKTLTHYFNCPYQLSNPPPGFNRTQLDKPSAAISASVKVEEGDLVVLASDGLFNNMHKEKLTEMFQDFKYTDQASLEAMTHRIVERTHSHSTDPTYMSPFAEQGSHILSWEFQGGKLDDITILLAAISNGTVDHPT